MYHSVIGTLVTILRKSVKSDELVGNLVKILTVRQIRNMVRSKSVSFRTGFSDFDK